MFYGVGIVSYETEKECELVMCDVYKWQNTYIIFQNFNGFNKQEMRFKSCIVLLTLIITP